MYEEVCNYLLLSLKGLGKCSETGLCSLWNFPLLSGREEGQLWYPRKVAVIRHSGKYVVCDRGNERSRMQIFTKNGHFIKKIAIRYIDIVAGLAITQQGEAWLYKVTMVLVR